MGTELKGTELLDVGPVSAGPVVAEAVTVVVPAVAMAIDLRGAVRDYV